MVPDSEESGDIQSVFYQNRGHPAHRSLLGSQVQQSQGCGSGSGLFGSPGSGSTIHKKTPVIQVFLREQGFSLHLGGGGGGGVCPEYFQG